MIFLDACLAIALETHMTTTTIREYWLIATQSKPIEAAFELWSDKEQNDVACNPAADVGEAFHLEGVHDTRTDALTRVLAQKLVSVTAVQRVYLCRSKREDQTIVRIWTVLGEVSRPNRRAVYEVEAEIIDQFPGILFDFYTSVRDEPQVPEYAQVFSRADA